MTYSPDDVMAQLFPARQANGQPPGDTIVLYEGADSKKNGFAPWKAWDVRSWINRLSWDLLRFKKIDDGVPSSDRTIPYGLRDTITAIWWLADQNNKLLHELLAANPDVADKVQSFRAQRDTAEPVLEDPFTPAVEEQLERMEAALSQSPTAAPTARLDTQTQVLVANVVAQALNTILTPTPPTTA